ncbi:MAG: hypothetical protein J5673_02750 [Candidatus Methanomethylophilaceae archaeon]|nr:hypothetical protein [Candidatus Methanomethylophilaceae archaeon]
MALKLSTSRRGGLWENDSMKELNLLGPYDKLNLIVFAIAFIASVAGMFVLVSFGIDILDSAMLLTAPFFILGLMWYNRTKKWSTLIVIVAVSAALYLYFHGLEFENDFYLQTDFIFLFAVDFIFVGSVGVVAFVSALQRFLFYRVITYVQSMNIKDKMTWKEKIVAFFFNVPNDIDTRNLTMDYNLKRASIPWSEIRETMTMGLMVGIFLWIYISMSPKFANIGTFSNTPVYIFAIVLYIPVIVMPWSIFNALHVRVETKYRDFTLYSGIKGTIKRMVLPMFAALIYVLTAFHDNDVMAVLSFIGTSIVMIILVIAFTSAIYYAYFENKLVDDIVSKWKVFRPVELLMSVEESTDRRTEYPGTPKRDMTEYGELVFEE